MKIKEALKETGKAERHDGNEQYAMKNEAGILCWYDKILNHVDSGITLGTTLADDWQPYHEVKEIRPENANEIWERQGVQWFTVKDRQFQDIHFYNALEDYKDICPIKNGNLVIHNKNGWKRIFPKVEDEIVETVEIGSVFFKGYEEFNERTVELNFLGCSVDKGYLKLRTIDHSTPMKVILEMPKI